MSTPTDRLAALVAVARDVAKRLSRADFGQPVGVYPPEVEIRCRPSFNRVFPDTLELRVGPYVFWSDELGLGSRVDQMKPLPTADGVLAELRSEAETLQAYASNAATKEQP